MSWLAPVDVRGLGELDRLVEFALGRVSVYAGRVGGGMGNGGGGGEEGAADGADADAKPADNKDLSRPPRGEGLNAPAILTLRNIRPKKLKGGDAGGDGTAGFDSYASSSAPPLARATATTTTTASTSTLFEAKLRATAERAGWTHVNYDAEGGVWVVKVAGF